MTRAGLLSLLAALVGLTLLLGGSLVVVEAAFAGAERDAGERAAALAASERLVAASGPIADRDNVLDASALEDFSEAELRALGAGERYAMAVRVDGETVASIGDPASGATVRRVVLVERHDRVQTSTFGEEIRVPRGVDEATVTVDSPATLVRADNRIVLYDSDDLDGSYDVEVDPRQNTTLSVDDPTEDVSVTYREPEREPAVLTVTVAEREEDDAPQQRSDQGVERG